MEQSTAELVMNTVHHPLGPSHGSISMTEQYKVFSLLTPVTGNMCVVHSYTLFLWWNMFFVSVSILPGGFCIQSVQPAHVKLIADCYPYYEPGYRLEHFKSCLSKAGMGVFTETTPPNLVCWILRDYDGSLHHLYTVEQYRRRGLASAVVRMMCKRIQDQDDVPFCYVYNDNHISMALFHSLGFTESQEQFFSLETD